MRSFVIPSFLSDDAPCSVRTVFRITRHASGWPAFPTAATIPYIRVGLRVTTLLVALLLAAACSSPPSPRRAIDDVPPAPASIGDEIAVRALAQVGKPYRYGGADLNGFDCSGLVFYIHRELGFEVPRTAAEQYSASQPVNVRHLEPGDLLFFRTTKKHAVSHVAIYAGDGRFVHSPQSGRAIELRDIDDDFYAPRLIGAGRLHR